MHRWKGLTRLLDDGRIELDSNVVERAIRPLALNRKNALFAGSDAGGQHWAVLVSLVEDLQTQRRRAPGLPRRRAHPAGEPSPQQPHR